MCGGRGTLDLSVPSAQFNCEPKTALQNKVCVLKKKKCHLYYKKRKRKNDLKKANVPHFTADVQQMGGWKQGGRKTELGQEEHFLRIALKLINLLHTNTPGGKAIPESDTRHFLTARN